MNKKERFRQRNKKVRDMFNTMSEKYPKWRFDAIVENIAANMFLSTRTIEAIIRKEGIYNDENENYFNEI